MTGLERLRLVVRGAILCGTVAVASTAVTAEPILFAVESTGRLPLEAERVLELQGLPGDIGVRIGKPGEIRFVSVARDDRDVEVPVEVWQDGRAIRVQLPADGRADPIRFEATVPPGVGVTIRDCGPDVTVANIEGDLDVTGSKLDLQAVGTNGSVRLDLADATLRLEVTAEDLDLQLVRVEGIVTRSAGSVVANIRESRIEVTGIAGDLELDAGRSELSLMQIRGRARVTARGGKLTLDSVNGGGVLRLEDTPLSLTAVHGDVEIETDADVRFESCKAAFHVNSYGGSVRGVGNEGLVEVKTDGATVELESVDGPVRVEGDSLQVRLVQVTGEVQAFTTSSDVVLEQLSSAARIEAEYGDVTASRVTGELDVVSRDGNVTVSDQVGPVVLTVDGDEVSVGWTSMTWSEDSRIENERGDVTVLLPKQGGCSVSAQSTYGGVESSIDEVEVSGDGSTGTGVLGRKTRPRLEIVAAGVIRILPATGGEAPVD